MDKYNSPFSEFFYVTVKYFCVCWVPDMAWVIESLFDLEWMVSSSAIRFGFETMENNLRVEETLTLISISYYPNDL